MMLVRNRIIGSLSNKVVRGQVSLLHNSTFYLSCLQHLGFSSEAASHHDEGESKQSIDVSADRRDNTKGPDEKKSTASRIGSKQKGEQGARDDLSVNDLMKIVAAKDDVLSAKDKEIKAMRDKVLSAYAEMENVMARTKREAENSRKFAIQNFAKSLLDVADNMGRASSVVKDSFAKIDTSKDTAGAVPLLKTLLEGVEMTEKQLTEVFKKFGIEKYDPTNEKFDPNRHNAVFQVPDPSKAPDTVAVVLKSGYALHERIIRPAEVGVTVAFDRNE
ncbi:hypothetical protein ACET3Z_017897 [Daucus carota]